MRIRFSLKTKLIIPFLLFLSACTFQVEVLNTPTPQGPESILVPFASATPVILEGLSATPPALPTFTAIVSSSEPSEVPTSSSPGVISVVFPPNATSENLAGSVRAGTSQTYSLNAFQGQIMSVSVLPDQPEMQSAVQLEIRGEDGTVLCPFKDYSCPFWRGPLPKTQQYLVNVTSQVAGSFVMKIAIDPPGTSIQNFRLDDSRGRYSLTYTDEFAPARFDRPELFKFPPEVVLRYVDTQQYIPTNLIEAYFTIGSSDDPQQVATCTEPASLTSLEYGVGEVTVNGNSYVRSEIQDVAAGNIYEQVFHRTVQNGVCYEIGYFTHFANIKNYAFGDVKEFDRAALLQKYEDILSTITFN